MRGRRRNAAVPRPRRVQGERVGWWSRGAEEEEKGGVVEGGGGLGKAPYRSAPRGPPVIGAARRGEGKGREGGALRQTSASLDQAAGADTRCTERCEGARGHQDGSPLEKKGAQMNLRR